MYRSQLHSMKVTHSDSGEGSGLNGARVGEKDGGYTFEFPPTVKLTTSPGGRRVNTLNYHRYRVTVSL